jgi:hypothetical protein
MVFSEALVTGDTQMQSRSRLERENLPLGSREGAEAFSGTLEGMMVRRPCHRVV